MTPVVVCLLGSPRLEDAVPGLGFVPDHAGVDATECAAIGQHLEDIRVLIHDRERQAAWWPR